VDAGELIGGQEVLCFGEGGEAVGRCFRGVQADLGDGVGREYAAVEEEGDDLGEVA